MKFCRPVFSVTLALLVLLSASSFSIGLHYCSGDLQEIALFAKAPACEKEKSLPPCHQEPPKHCCEDTILTHHAEQTVQTQAIQHHVNLTVLADLTLTNIILAEVIPSLTSAAQAHIDYSPPTPLTDLTVILRVFLI